MKNIFDELKVWREERGIDLVKTTAVTTLKHMLLEITEAMEALENDDFDGVIDGIVDAGIYGINGLEQMQVDAESSFAQVIKELHSRKGHYDHKEGKFQKVITGNEYKADFSGCLRGASVGGQSTACTIDE